MPLQSSPATMSLSDIYQNINETGDEMPSGGTNVSLHTLSETMENASAIGPTSRVDISADPRAFSEFYGYHYPGGYSGLGDVLYLGEPTDTPLTNDTLVEGEDLGVYFEHYDQDDGHETVVSIVTSAGVAATGDDTSAVFEQDDDVYGEDAINSVLLTVDTYEGATMKVKVVDDDNAYDSNILPNTFTYRDSIAGHGVTTLTNSVGGGGYTSTTVAASGDSVNNVIVTPTVTTGTQASATSIGVANLIAGDGGTMGASDGGENWTISNTPGKIRFTTTHQGFGVAVGRNQTTSTADFNVTYARAIDDIARNASTFNSGDTVTISAVGEGVSGAHTMRLGYHKTEANDSFTAYTDESVLESLYVRQAETENFTLTLTTGTVLKTFYPKALYTAGVSERVTGTAFTLAPAYSYSTTGNTTIDVNTTQAFAVSSVIGYGSSVAITSSPNIGSGTNSATMTPLLKTGTFTITFTGTADYSQTSNTTDILSVDPTVSVALTDDTLGLNFPITDAHSDTISSGTHGVSPTIFTHTPTVVGTLKNGLPLTYLWTSAGSNFTYTGASGTATAGAVTFKKNSSGTLSHQLTVTGDNDRDASDSTNVVCQSVTKTVSGVTIDVLRSGTTFSVTSISTAYTQTVALYRQNAMDGWDKIANGVTVASTINFSLTGDAIMPDPTARAVRLVDDDNTGIYDGLGSFAILNVLPTITSFTATASTTMGQIDLAWSITNAATVTITVNTGTDPGSQTNANNNSYIVTGLGNNLTRTYTLTVANANGESVDDQDSATTVNPSITLGTPDDSSWTWADTGNVTLVAQKNFANSISGYMGYSLDTTETGGTELQTLVNQGSGKVDTDFNLVFDKNDWNYQSSLGSAIVDFRAGHADASFILQDNVATVNDFSIPNNATSGNALGTSGTGITITWTNPTGNYTGVKLYGGIQGDTISLLVDRAAGQSPSYSHGSLTQGTTYEYYLVSYYSKTANGVTRTRSNQSATFTGTTISWDSISVAGLVMLPTAGTGWNDTGGGLTSGQEDAYLQSAAETGTLYHLSSQVLGTHTVSLRRSEDGATWNGTNDWYGDSESNDVFYIETDGDVAPANFVASANVKPDGPADATATANSTSQITITWSCTSAIETGFKIFRSTSSYPDSSGTPINSPAANATSYVNTGLDDNEQYYYSVYSYRGSTVSSVRATATATTPASPTVDSMAAAASATNGQIDVTWETSNIGQITLYTATNSYMVMPTTLLDVTAGTWYDATYWHTGLGDNTQRWYRIRVIGNGETVYSDIVTATTNEAATAWSSVPGDFAMEGAAFQTEYSSLKTITLSNGSGNSQVSQTGGVYVALSTSGDPGTSGTANSGTGFGSSKSIAHTTGTLYMRFKYVHGKSATNFNSDVTFSNNSVSNTALDIDVTTSTIA